MKKVIVIGAAGASSKQIIPRILEQEDVQLTLFVRKAHQLKGVQHPRVTIVEGDATHLDDLRNAIQGQDIVISTMGGMDLDKKVENIVEIMQEVASKRLIVMSAGGIYDELPEPFNDWDKQMVGYTRPVNLRTADVVEASSLDYTVLRPVWLTNKSVEDFELTQKGEIFKGTETSRASIGRLIANIVANPQQHVKENLGISQAHTDGPRPAAYR